MKTKLFTLFLALVASVSFINATDYYFAGAANYWSNNNDKYKFVEVEGVLTLEVEDLYGDFKITENGAWHPQHGAAAQGEGVALNGSYNLVKCDDSEGEKDAPASCKILTPYEGDWRYKDAKLTLNAADPDHLVIALVAGTLYDHSAAPVSYYLVGACTNNWSMLDAIEFADVNGVLTATVPDLNGPFKIIQDHAWDNQWATNWNTGAGLVLGEPYILGAKGDQGAPANLALANPFYGYKNAVLTLTIDGDNHVLKLVSGTSYIIENDWYIPGSKLGWNCDDVTKFDAVEGQANAYELQLAEFGGEFKVVYGQWMVEFGAPKGEDGNWVNNSVIALAYPGDYMKPKYPNDVYKNVRLTLVVDYENVKVNLYINQTPSWLQPNVYASSIKGFISEGGAKMDIEYLLNADATALEIEFFNDNQEIVAAVPLSDATLLTRGAHQTTITIPSAAKESIVLSWAIHAHGSETEFKNLLKQGDPRYSFYLPQDVVVDNSFESDYFGRVYLSMPWEGEDDGGYETTRVQKRGLYYYEPTMDKVNGTLDVAQNGFDGGLGGAIHSRNGIKRLAIDDKGFVYVASRDAETKGVYRADPSDLSKPFTTVLAASAAVDALEVLEGKLVTIEGVDGEYNGAFNTYDLSSIPVGNPIKSLSAAERTLANTDITIRSDHRGGFWVTQHRYSLDNYSPLMHWNKQGNIDFIIDPESNSDLLSNSDGGLSYRGTLGVSVDGNMVAVSSNRRAVVFDIEWSDEGVPTLTKKCETPKIGNNIDGIAFDVADNVYFASASDEQFHMYPIAKSASENHCRVFAPSKYYIYKNSITVTTLDSQYGIVIGDTITSYMSQVTIEAIPNYGYHFVSWNDGNTDNPRTITVTKNETFTATFAKNVYSITKVANSAQGSISGPSQAEYLDQVTLKAEPNYGYYFTQWSDGNKTNPRSFELTCDTTFTAEFAPNQYTLSLQCDSEQGIVEGAGTFDYQAQAEIYATPAYGYHFSSWSDGNTDNPRKYTVTKDVTLTANFAPNIYSISVSCNSEQGQVTGGGSYAYLSNRSLEATPNYGYHFTKWSDGNTDNPRTIELRQDTAFVAIFAIDKSGTCGDNLLLTWQYDSSNGILTISGEGDLTTNKRYGVEAIGEMRELIVEDGVGIIGDDAFANIKTLKSVSLGKDVRKLQERVFYNCYNLEAIYSYRRTPAAALTNTFEEVDKYACTIYVMAGSEDMFRTATGWKDFYSIRAIGASETTVTNEEVTVAPTETTAAVTWPAVENAATYELVIRDKNGNVVCTLIFNANGQLTEIAFAAPGRSQRSGQIAGFSFTVTGLDSGTGYDLTINAKDSEGEVINTTTQSFTTVSSVTTGVDATLNASPVHKQLIDGVLYILRDGKTYTVQGQEVS